MVGILYFSSTGNSLYIASQIQKELGGKVLYLPSYNGDASEFEKVILVTPIYSFGMPKHVYEFLPKMSKTTPLVVVQNYGGMVGGADYLVYKYCQKYGLKVKSMYLIKMPENFTVTFTVPRFYIKSTLKKAEKRIKAVIESIKNSEQILPKPKKTKEAKYLKNMSNWHIIGNRFTTNSNCIKCGKCMQLCPVGNITITKGKVEFGDKCVGCLGCYHRCPQKAILYKNKTKKDRYINPNIIESQIGKDIP